MEPPLVAASTGWLALVALAVAGLLVVCALTLRPVPTDDALSSAVRAWRRRRLVALAGGIVLGTAVAVVYVWGTGADRGRAVPDLLLVGAVVGAAGAGGLAGLGRLPRRRGNARVASAVAVPARDLTLRSTRIAARVMVLVAVALTALTFLGTVTSPRFTGLQPVPSPAQLLTLVAVLVWVASLVVAHVVAAVPQSANDDADLRAGALVRRLVVRDATVAAAGTGLAAALLTVPELVAAFDVPFVGRTTFAALTWTAPVLAGTVLVAVVVANTRRIAPGTP